MATKKYNVYQVPKIGKPTKIVSGLNKIQARKVVRSARTGKDFFVGFTESGKKVSNRSSFKY
jgi:hypothetical protein